MLAYTLDAVAEARSVAAVVVVTDDPLFKQTAERLGVCVVDEPPELAADSSPVFPAVALATQEAEARLRRTFDEVVICDANVPVRPPGIIDDVVAALRDDSTFDLAISVEPCGRRHPEWAVRLGPDGTATFPGVPPELSQDLPTRYFVTSAAHAIRRGAVSNTNGSYLNLRVCGVVHAPDTALDIDTAEALPYIEFILARQRESVRAVG
jgi:CMP-N-acetylneuraminic acid synthetase